MPIGFRVRLDDRKWSKPLHADEVRPRAKRLLSGFEGPFRVRRDDDRWGPKRTLKEALDRLDTWASKQNDAGSRFAIRSSDDHTLVTRAVEVPVVADVTNGNSKVDRFVLVAKWDGFGDIENWGVTVCKNIAGTSTPSQHTNWAKTRSWKSMGYISYDRSCGGNAIDCHFDTQSRMDAFAKWCVSKMDELDIQNIIWNRRIYTRESRTWRAYSGVNPHTDHVHVDFTPSRSGATLC
jgi:hypothetical protein